MKNTYTAQLETDLILANELLRRTWDHMHGINMDGSRSKYGDDDAIARNWNKLSDAIGDYLEPVEK